MPKNTSEGGSALINNTLKWVLGIVLTILISASTAFVSYGRLEQRVDSTEVDLKEHSAIFGHNEMTNLATEQGSEIKHIKEKVDKLDEKVDDIKEDMSRQTAAQVRIETLLETVISNQNGGSNPH